MKREIEVEITPAEAAAAFAEWDADQQAAFFDTVAHVSNAWPGAGWCQQAYSIVRALDKSGQGVIGRLADHYASHFGWEPSK